MILNALLLVAATPNVVTEPLSDGRFRVSTTIGNSNSVEEQVRAQLRLRAAAQEQCHGRGNPVSDGALELNRVPDRPNRLSLSEVYSCGGPAD